MYTVRARAVGAGGSAEASITFATPGFVAPAPPGVSIVSITALASGTEISLAWSVDEEGGALTGQTLLYGGTAAVSLPITARQAVVGSLSKNSAYTLSVVAVNAVGAATAVATATTPATAPGLPSVGIFPTPDGLQPERLTLVYSAPDNGGSEVTLFRFRNGIYNQTLLATNERVTQIIADPERFYLGFDFVFRVAAINAVGQGDFITLTARAERTPPHAPQNFAATANAGGTVSLSWTANSERTYTGSGGEIITAYILTYGTVSTNYPNQGAAVITAALGQAYAFTLRAQNVIGIGPAAVASLSIAAATAPAAPTTFAAAATPQGATPAQVTLSWSAPANGGAPLTAYILSYGTVSAVLPASQTATVVGVSVGVGYVFTLQAANSVGASPAAVASASIAAPPPAAGLPDAPVLHHVWNNGVGLYYMYAQPPDDDGGSPISVIVARFSDSNSAFNPGGTPYTWRIAVSANTDYPIQIQEFYPYIYLSDGETALSLWAENAIGAGATAVYSPISRNDGPPTAPRNVRANAASGEITVSWRVPWYMGVGSGATFFENYFIDYGGAATLTVAVVANVRDGRNIGAFEQTVVITTDTSAPRGISVWTSNNSDASPVAAATAAAVAGPPNAPVIVATANANGVEISLSWSANDSGSPITAYLYSFNGGEFVALAGNVTSTVETGLAKNRPHTISVAAVNANGTSAFALAVARTPATNPDKPRNVRAVEVGDGFVVIAWDEPASWGGSSMSVYRPYYREESDSWSRVGGGDVTVYAASYTLTQTGLTNGNAYHFHVLAQSRANLWSQNFVTELLSPSFVATVTATPVAPPSAPVIAAAGSADGLEITLSWSANANGSSITAYFYSFNGGEVVTLAGSVASTVETGLVRYSPYTMSMAAANALGTSAFTVAVVSTRATPPSNLQNISVKRGNLSFVLSWSEPADWGGSTLSIYRIGWRDSNDNTDILETADNKITLTSHHHGGGSHVPLIAGNVYYVIIGVRSQANLESDYVRFPASGFLTAIALPSAPIVTARSQANGTQISVGWRAANNDVSNAAITAYALYLGSVSVTLTGGATATVVDGLAQNITHTLSVVALNDAGAGSASVLAVFTRAAPPSDLVLNAAPTPPVAIPTQVTLSWSANANTSPITAYYLSYGAITATLPGNASQTVVGVSFDVEYAFTLRAANVNGESAAAAQTVLIAAALPPSRPVLSYSRTPAGVTPAKITLSWSANANGSPITAYFLSYGTVTAALSPVQTLAVVTVADVNAGQRFTLRAANTVGVSEPAALVFALTSPNSGNIHIDLISHDTARGRAVLQARAGGPVPLDHFRFIVYRGSQPTNPQHRVEEAIVRVDFDLQRDPTIRHTITALVQNTKYAFYIQGGNNAGRGGYRNVQLTSPARGMLPPQNFVAEPGNGFVRLSWQPPPPNNDTGVVSQYRLSRGEGVDRLLNSNILTYQYSGLQNYQAVTFRILVRDSANVEGLAAVVTAYPGFHAPGVPYSDGADKRLFDSAGQVVASAGVFRGLARARPYGVNVDVPTESWEFEFVSGGAVWTVTAAGANNVITVSSGLTGGAHHLIRAIAVNPFGKTKGAAFNFYPPKYHGAQLPHPLLVTSIASFRQVFLNWRASPTVSSLPYGYRIVAKRGGAAVVTVFANDVRATVGLPGAEGAVNGVAHTFEIAAHYDGETGAPLVVTQTPNATNKKPEPPRNFRPVPYYENGEFRVAWERPFSHNQNPQKYEICFNIHPDNGYFSSRECFLDPAGDQNINLQGKEPAGHATVYSYAGEAPRPVADYELRRLKIRVQSENTWSDWVHAFPEGQTLVVGPWPKEPQNLANDGLNLTWSAPVTTWSSTVNAHAVTAYRLESRLAGESDFVFAAQVTALSAALNANNYLVLSSYQVRVQGINGKGGGLFATATVQVLPSAPTPPRGVSVVEAGDGFVRLAWQSPVFTGGVPLQSYILQTAAAAGAFSELSVYAASVLAASVFSPNGETKRFRLLARNGRNSAPSPTVAAAAGAPPVAPSAVSVAVEGANAVVRWRAPANNRGFAVTGYIVSYAPAGGGAAATLAGVGGSQTVANAPLAGFVLGSSYLFSVAAVNARGAGAFAAATVAVIGPPAAPQSLQGVAGLRSVVLSWSAPAQDGGASVVAYVAATAAAAAGPYLPQATVLASALSVAFAATPARALYARVFARNAAGHAGAVAQSGALTPGGAPDAPYLRSTRVNATAVFLQWDSPAANGYAITDYIVQYKEGLSTGDFITYNDGSSTVADAWVEPLSLGVAYVFRIRAVNSRGQSDYSNTVSNNPANPPSAPRNFRLVPADNGRMTIFWDPPLSNGGKPLSGYDLMVCFTDYGLQPAKWWRV